MDQQTYLILFENASAAEANGYAEDLRDVLLDAIPDIQVERKRHDLTTQNAGEILQVILTSPLGQGTLGAAVFGLLSGVITTWLKRNPNASLTLKRPQGDIIASNISDRTVVKLTKLHLQHENEEEKK